jgi:hypothetical protein
MQCALLGFDSNHPVRQPKHLPDAVGGGHEQALADEGCRAEARACADLGKRRAGASSNTSNQICYTPCATWDTQKPYYTLKVSFPLVSGKTHRVRRKGVGACEFLVCKKLMSKAPTNPSTRWTTTHAGLMKGIQALAERARRVSENDRPATPCVFHEWRMRVGSGGEREVQGKTTQRWGLCTSY